MAKPKKLTKEFTLVCGELRVDVCYTDSIVMDNGDRPMGLCDYANQMILVDKNYTPDMRGATLMHEIVHFVADSNGIELTEQNVSTLGHSLYQMLKPMLKKQFTKVTK